MHAPPTRCCRGPRRTAAEPTLQDGYVTNRLTLDGPELPGTAAGARIALYDARGELVTSYQVLKVLGPHEVLLSEARRVRGHHGG